MHGKLKAPQFIQSKKISPYNGKKHPPGKSAEEAGEGQVQFVRLVENQCIEQSIVFKSDQPEFSGIIKITWTFQKTDGGNEVSVKCDDVPVGISQEDHEAGITASHNKLAMFVE